MLGIATGLFLIFTFIVVHIYSKPKSADDFLGSDDLPFPGAGQGSSIFSLTALFGAYLGIFFLVGLSGLLGLGLGSITGLFIIRKKIISSKCDSFELFVESVLTISKDGSMKLFFIFVALLQMLLAVSELSILNDILQIAFNFSNRYAIVTTISISLVCYLYCLWGGYLAVYRTDIVQFLFILIMGAIISFAFIFSSDGTSPLTEASVLSIMNSSKTNYWIQFESFSILNQSLNCMIAFAMGFGFIISSPDTWKRVFVSVKFRGKRTFYTLIIAGCIPFILLLPLGFIEVANITEIVHFKFVIEYLNRINPIYNIFIMLGILSCFLSSFDSAMISSVHPLLLIKDSYRNNSSKKMVLIRYYWGSLFVALILIFLAFESISKNSYLIGSIMLGPYAVIVGIMIGSNGLKRRFSKEFLIWTSAITLLFWNMYLFLTYPSLLEGPLLEQIESIPIGVLVLLIIIAFSHILTKKRV